MLQKEKFEQVFQKIMQQYDNGLQKEVLLQELVRKFNLDVQKQLHEQIETLLERNLTTTESEKVKTLSFLHHHGTGRKGYSYFRITAILLTIMITLWMGTFALLSYPPLPPASTYTTPTALPAFTATPTVTTPPTPLSVIPAPTFVLADQCKLPVDSVDHDYLVPEHLLLKDVYRIQFDSEPDFNDLYAIAYYNNRKILEGYNIYHLIDPVSLDVRRGWNIFIPPQKWIDEYKKFPATIPLPAQIDFQSKLDISGSSVLSHLSAQISKCSAETTKVELIQIDSGNTVSGLRDLCQGKVDLFGANRAVAPESSCVELEEFEVARYAMVVLINKNNPYADDMQSKPLTNEELTELLTTARSWKDVREYWNNNKPIARHYPSLESGEFEIVKNSIFPDGIVDQDDIHALSIYNNKQSLIDNLIADANAVGIVDYDSYDDYQNQSLLIPIPVNGVYVGSAVESDNGSAYPLMATLYLYVGKTAYEKDDVLRSFINYYLSHELDFLEELGYLYPSRKGYADNRDTVP